jgi:hypothetical protein
MVRGGVARNSASAEFARLEARQLFSTINVMDFGAIANGQGNSRGAIEAALDSAKPGDTVVFPTGEFKIRGDLNVPSGVTVSGAGSTSTHLIFTLNQPGDGLNLDGNDSNVTVEGFDITSNYGVLGMTQGSYYSNVAILGNSIQYARGSTTSDWGDGMEITVPNDQTTIEYNYFHDSPVIGARNWSIYDPTNAEINYNLDYNIWDGGHIMVASSSSSTNSYSFNYGTEIINKGIEIQSYGPGTQGNFTVDGNVFYNWLNPNGQTFGLSIPLLFSPAVSAKDNYIAATVAPGSSMQAGQHFGYGIEFGGINAVASGNILIGPWGNGTGVGDFGYSAQDEQFNNNQLYGVSPGTNPFSEEPGQNPSAVLGSGSKANLIDSNVNDAPAPPTNTFAGPAYVGQVVSLPAPTGGSTASAPASSSSASSSNSSSGDESTTQRLEDITQYRSTK